MLEFAPPTWNAWFSIPIFLWVDRGCQLGKKRWVIAAQILFMILTRWLFHFRPNVQNEGSAKGEDCPKSCDKGWFMTKIYPYNCLLKNQDLIITIFNWIPKLFPFLTAWGILTVALFKLANDCCASTVFIPPPSGPPVAGPHPPQRKLSLCHSA